MNAGILDGDSAFTIALVLSLTVLLNIIIEAVCDAWDEYKLESRQRMTRLDGRK